MSLGPWFKCYPKDFLSGMCDMDARKQGFYCQIIFRIYESANAIYASDRIIGRWCNSNARAWLKIKEELIAEGKLVQLPDGGLINSRALEEMLEQAGKSDDVPEFVIERLLKIDNMFRETFAKDSRKFRESLGKDEVSQKIRESFAKDSRKFRETCPENTIKTKPIIEVRNQKSDRGSAHAHAREPPTSRKTGKARGSARATRIPDNWQLTPKDLAFASKKGLSTQEIQNEADRFRNYWIAAAGAKARKRDWQATWRNWITSDYGPVERKRKTASQSSRNTGIADQFNRFADQIASDFNRREIERAHDGEGADDFIIDIEPAPRKG